MKNFRKYFAEFIGTFIMVFCATGAMIVNELTEGSVTHVGVCLVTGLIIMAVIYSIGEISGAHINPAVSFGFALAGKFKTAELIPYISSQISGAFFASVILHFLFPASIFLGSTNPAGPELQSFILEILLSFFMMFVIMNVSQGSREQGIMAGIAIGAVVMLNALFGGPVSGASMNPARSIAPAIISGNISHLWIYLTAPFLGISVAVLVFKIIRSDWRKVPGFKS